MKSPRSRTYLISLILLLALLTGCAAPQTPQTGDVAPQRYTLASDTRVRKSQVQTLLLIGVGYDAENHSSVSTLLLAVLDRTPGQESIQLTALPKDTRAFMAQYSEGKQASTGYAPLSQAYYSAESANLGESNTMDAVADVLLGVKPDDYLALNIVQLKQLIKLTRGVYMDVDAEAAYACGTTSGNRRIDNMLESIVACTSLRSADGIMYPGTDTSMLLRRERLAMGFINALALAQQDDQTIAETLTQTVRTSFTAQELQLFLTDASAAAQAHAPRYTVLPGEDGGNAGAYEYLPDQGKVKQWLLDTLYTE